MMAALRRYVCLALALCAAALAGEASFAQVMPPTTLPAITIGTAALISPADAASRYTAATTATDGLKAIMGSGTATPVPPEIVEMARALKNNPDLIYEYVRNNIDVSWMYGLQKGALGALIDKSGTPFDQAALMVALLTQAGYSASYQAGNISLSGAQFTAWTGIADANAACQMLANGGFPASVNSTTATTCANVAGGTITNVTMAHLWVSVVIGGTSYVFDPSYKTYTWSAGVNLATATGLTGGQPLADATSLTMTSGVDTGVPYVRQLNSPALNTRLSGYAQSLLNYIYANGLTGKHLQDITGGGILQPYVSPPGGLRQTTNPFGTATTSWACSAGQWPCTVPDQYRTKLTVTGSMLNGSTGVVDTMFSVAFFADEIYGRRLTVNTDFVAGSGTAKFYDNIVTLRLDDVTLRTYTNPSPNAATHMTARGYPTELTLAVDHPYAAAADGTATATTHDYMDATVTKPVILITALTVVAGFGDTSAALFKKWSDERIGDGGTPRLPYPPNDCSGEPCTTYFSGTIGDFTRTKAAANWLAQYTRAAHLHADIAGSVVQLHHALGFVYSDNQLKTSYQHTPTVPADLPQSSIADSFDRIDVDSAFSLSSRSASATTRRAAIQAVAATASALEGSVAAQMSDLPDTVSTATRFEWGNTPPGTAGNADPVLQDPSGVGPRRFYQFTAATASLAPGIVQNEGHPSTYVTPCTQAVWTAQPAPCGDFAAALAADISAYTAAGFTVTTSQEAFLGPGQRGGTLTPVVDPGGPYNTRPTKQRGSALVATRYDANGDPVQIAHVVSGIGQTGIGAVITKGGGGGAQPDQQTHYAPAEPADVLKSRFVDKSNVLGVSLASGTPSGSGPKLDVGTGGFPYELTASLAWRAGVPVDNGLTPTIPTQPQAGWTSNWSNNLALSGSGLEGMGESDIREAVGAIAAFYAAQDIYKSSPSVQRDVAAVLTQSWWAHQIASNVATVTVGPSAQQFVQLPPGVTLPGSSVNWFAPGGTYATLAMTGTRTAYEFICSGPPTPPYAMSRGWDSSGLSFAITSAAGDVQHFAYWGMTYATSDSPTAGACGQAKGFRLTSWTFPSGVAVTLTYGNGYPPSGGGDLIDNLVSVQNSLGRKISFSADGTGFDNGLTGGDLRRVTLTPGGGVPFEYTAMTDPIGAVTHYTYLAPLITSSTQRPVPYDLLSQVFTADNASLPNLQYDYDGLGRVKQVRDALNLQGGGRAPWQFFIADGTRGERDDPLGGAYSVTYDIFNNPWRYIDEIGRETDQVADGRGRVVSTTYPEQDQELFTYDVRNNALSLTRVPKPGSPLTNIVLSASYGEAATVAACANPIICNKRFTSTSGNGAVTNITYDSATGLPTQMLLPADPAGNRPRTDFGYSTFGSGFTLFTSQTQYITPTVTTVTSFTHNSSNDYVPLTATVDSGSGKLNLTTTFTFDAQGSIVRIDGPRSDVTDVSDFTWDADRRIVFNIQPDPDGTGANPRPAAKNTYDAVGRVIQTDRGTTTSAIGADFASALTVTTAYDPTSNKIRETTPTRVTQFSYDGANRALCTTIRMNPAVYGALPDACTLSAQGTFGPDRIVKITYDAAGQTLVEQRAFGTALVQAYATNTWTANGQLASVFDADGPTHVTNYTYDGFDRLSITTFADSAVGHLDLEQIARYDADNNPLVRITRSAQIVNYAYDALDRVCIKVMTAPTVTPPAGCHATAQASPAVTTFSTYDLLNRATGATDTNGNTLATVYDNAGRMTSATRATALLSAKTVNYTYDPAGNRTRLTWPDGYYAQYAYDALNHPVSVVDSGSTTLAAYTYDTLARRTTLQYNGATGAKMLYAWSVEDDLVTLSSDLAVGGNLAATTNDVAFGHSFTPAHQWATATISNPAFRYMPATTVTTPYAAANVLNQYGTVGGVAQTYDTRGNLTSDGTRTYTYDTENRLLTATASGLSASYAYDPLGRRTAKTVTLGAATATAFVHDGASEIAEYDVTGTNGPTGALLRRFVPGPGIDEYIAMVTVAGVKTYFHTDKMGSVIAMSDASGNLAEGPYTYDPYGNCFSGGVPCVTGVPFRYTGQKFDPETGLFYYRARYYDPKVGRFLQTDPVGTKDDLNLYTYVGNDPTDKTDSSGQRIVINYGFDLVATVRAFLDLLKLYHSKEGDTVRAMSDSSFTVTIGPRISGMDGNNTGADNEINAQNGVGSDAEIFFDPSDRSGGVDDKGSTDRPPYVGLAHELLGHANDIIHGTSKGPTPKSVAPGTTPIQEETAIRAENKIRRENHLTPRSTYSPKAQTNSGSSNHENGETGTCSATKGGCGSGGAYEIWGQ